MARPRAKGSALGQRARCFHERKPAERDGESVGYDEGSAAERGQDGEPSWRKGGPRAGWETHHIWGRLTVNGEATPRASLTKVEQGWVWAQAMEGSHQAPPSLSHIL